MSREEFLLNTLNTLNPVIINGMITGNPKSEIIEEVQDLYSSIIWEIDDGLYKKNDEDSYSLRTEEPVEGHTDETQEEPEEREMVEDKTINEYTKERVEMYHNAINILQSKVEELKSQLV